MKQSGNKTTQNLKTSNKLSNSINQKNNKSKSKPKQTNLSNNNTITVKPNIKSVENQNKKEEIPTICPNCGSLKYTTIKFDPCTHEYCGMCLSQNLLKNDFQLFEKNVKKVISLDCPKCNKGSVTIPIEQLAKNIQDSCDLKIKKPEAKLCEVHKKNAEEYCIECKKWFCADCKTLFHNNYFKDHKLVKDEEEIKNLTSTTNNINNYKLCELHNKYKDLICLKCSEEVCHMCGRAKNAHYQHKLIPIEEYKKNAINAKKNFAHKTYEEFDKFISTKEKEFRNHFNNCKNKNIKTLEILVTKTCELKRIYEDKMKEFEIFYTNFFKIIKGSYFHYYFSLKEKNGNKKDIRFIQSIKKEIDNISFIEEQTDLLNLTLDDLDKINKRHFFNYNLEYISRVFKLTKTINDKSYHKQTQIYSICPLKNGKILTGGDDTNITEWDIDADNTNINNQANYLNCNNKIDVLRGHKKIVYSILELSDGRIISASGDKDIRVWMLDKANLENYRKSNPMINIICNFIKNVDKPNANQLNNQNEIVYKIVRDGKEIDLGVANPKPRPKIQGKSAVKNQQVTVETFTIEIKKKESNKLLNSLAIGLNKADKEIKKEEEEEEKKKKEEEEKKKKEEEEKKKKEEEEKNKEKPAMNPISAAIKTATDKMEEESGKKKKKVKNIANLDENDLGDVDEYGGFDESIKEDIKANPPRNSILSSTGNINTTSNITDKRCIKILRGHNDEVFSLLELKNKNVCSCSKDSTIIIWDMNNFSQLKILKGHSSSVGAIALHSENTLISGSADKTLKVWHIQNLENVTNDTLSGHKNGIYSLAILKNGHVASGSCDKTIKIWDILKKELICDLLGHDGWVWTVVALADENKLVSGGADGVLKVWDLENKKCELTRNAHLNPITSLCNISNRRLISGGFDEFKIWEY